MKLGPESKPSSSESRDLKKSNASRLAFASKHWGVCGFRAARRDHQEKARRQEMVWLTAKDHQERTAETNSSEVKVKHKHFKKEHQKGRFTQWTGSGSPDVIYLPHILCYEKPLSLVALGSSLRGDRASVLKMGLRP